MFEAIDAVKRTYRIDENRILVRGFSMGGASAWHLAAHHAGLWAAAVPGAGFAETPEYTKIMQDPEKPTWWQQKLWHLYDATDYAANLANTAVVERRAVRSILREAGCQHDGKTHGCRGHASDPRHRTEHTSPLPSGLKDGHQSAGGQDRRRARARSISESRSLHDMDIAV